MALRRLCKRTNQPGEEGSVTRVEAARLQRDVLEQLRFRVAPRKSNIDDERNPAVVEDGLWHNPTRKQTNMGGNSETSYTSNLNSLVDTFLDKVQMSGGKEKYTADAPLCLPKASWCGAFGGWKRVTEDVHTTVKVLGCCRGHFFGVAP